MEGAYVHRPTTLSLWSWDLLMECSQDHFTYDALGGQGGDKSDGVVDGDICYQGVIFLTWVSKHKKEDLHAAHGTFLFIGVCPTTMENLFMDPYIILLLAHGKNFTLTYMDYLTQYLCVLTIPIQCIAPQEGKLLFGLHGHILAKYCDGDNHLLCSLGKMFHYSFMYDHLVHQSIYY